MKFLLIVAAALICGVSTIQKCGRPAIAPFENNIFGKIVGGREARKGSWPWQAHFGATIDYFGESAVKRFCGATIINARWVITAAHCIIPGANDTFVRVGQHNQSIINEPTARDYYVEKIYSHPEYRLRNVYDNDIALLKLFYPIQFTNEISPICLPPNRYEPQAGTRCLTAGWGMTGQRNGTYPPPPAPTFVPPGPSTNQPVLSETPAVVPDVPPQSDVLKQTVLQIVDRNICNSSLHYNGSILDSMICADGKGEDTCQSDSGGPLICKNEAGSFELVGVVSWGYGCADLRYPGAYSYVGLYIPWIKAVTGL